MTQTLIMFGSTSRVLSFAPSSNPSESNCDRDARWDRRSWCIANGVSSIVRLLVFMMEQHGFRRRQVECAIMSQYKSGPFSIFIRQFPTNKMNEVTHWMLSTLDEHIQMHRVLHRKKRKQLLCNITCTNRVNCKGICRTWWDFLIRSLRRTTAATTPATAKMPTVALMPADDENRPRVDCCSCRPLSEAVPPLGDFGWIDRPLAEGPLVFLPFLPWQHVFISIQFVSVCHSMRLVVDL